MHCLYEQVKMVVHETVPMNENLKLLSRLLNAKKKLFPVSCSSENILSAATTVDYVIDGARICDS